MKENIVKGDAVNLYDFPVPGGIISNRGEIYNTYATQVTMDPESKIMNAGVYRGMIGDDEKSISVLLSRSQHWGIHYSKYEQRGEEMPHAPWSMVRTLPL